MYLSWLKVALVEESHRTRANLQCLAFGISQLLTIINSLSISSLALMSAFQSPVRPAVV